MRKIFLGVLALALLVAVVFVTVVPAEANRVTITIRNGTSYTMTNLYVTTENFSGKPIDVLGSGVLRPGGSQNVDALPGRRYVVRAIDTDGDVYSFTITTPQRSGSSWTIQMSHMHRG